MTRGYSLRVLHRIRTTIRRCEMLRRGDAVVVAVSGGPDSMALLHLLRRLERDLALRLHVAHVDHGLHVASRAHAAFVRRTAVAWGLRASVRRVSAARYAQRHRLSPEEAARAVRYRALTDVARRVGARAIAMGHTADDQAETVLLWLLRGAASDGLAGMPAVRMHEGFRLIRPLIDVWRAEVTDYLANERVPYRTDPTNRLRRPLRNRIRHDLLPHLTGYNPGVKAVLRRLALQVADDAALLDRYAATASGRTLHQKRDSLAIDLKRFRALPPSLQRRVAYRAVVGAGGNIRDVAFVHIERLREMAGSGHRREHADLPGVDAERENSVIVLRRAGGSRARPMVQ